MGIFSTHEVLVDFETVSAHMTTHSYVLHTIFVVTNITVVNVVTSHQSRMVHFRMKMNKPQNVLLKVQLNSSSVGRLFYHITHHPEKGENGPILRTNLRNKYRRSYGRLLSQTKLMKMTRLGKSLHQPSKNFHHSKRHLQN